MYMRQSQKEHMSKVINLRCIGPLEGLRGVQLRDADLECAIL
jgi:hypothetical protein